MIHYYLFVSQVLVPLVLLQALQSEDHSVSTLLHLGVRFLEEAQGEYINQQGGYVSALHFCSLSFKLPFMLFRKALDVGKYSINLYTYKDN